jgi:hypothetical protein
MNSPDNNKKDLRRQKFLSKSAPKRDSVSEEQRFLSKSKKQLKKKIEDIRGDELWEDWEDNNY